MRWLSRLRASLMTGLTWAVVWGVAGAIMSPVLRILANAPDWPLQNAVIFGVVNAWYGFLAGCVFAIVVMIAGRHRSFDDLTVGDLAKWGVTASLLLTVPPFLYMLSSRSDGWRSGDLVYLTGSAVLCTACAIGTLLIARRGSDASVAQTMLASPPLDFARVETDTVVMLSEAKDLLLQAGRDKADPSLRSG